MEEIQKRVPRDILKRKLVNPMENVAAVFHIIVGEGKAQRLQEIIEHLDEIWTEETVDKNQWPLVEMARSKGRFRQACHIRIPRNEAINFVPRSSTHGGIAFRTERIVSGRSSTSTPRVASPAVTR